MIRRLALCLLLSISTPLPAAAEEASESWLAARVWSPLVRCVTNPDDSRLVDWLPLVLSFGLVAGLQLGLEPPDEARWEERNGFDDGIRGGLRARSRSGRRDARWASHALLGALGAATVADYAFLCDRVPLEDDPTPGDPRYNLLRMLRTDVTAFLLNNAANRTARLATGRERPYVRPCRGDPDYVAGCRDGADHNASFYSGHASMGTLLGSLLCVRHLYREPVPTGWDRAVCGAGIALGLGAGAMRVVADRHFPSDVLAGWTAGALFGGYLTYRMNYGDRPDPAPVITREVGPFLEGDAIGLRFSGRF